MKAVKSIEGAAVRDAFESIVRKIAERHRETEKLAVAGVANGGLPFAKALARRLSERLGRKVPCGVVNNAFHRDDIGRQPIPPSFQRTDLPFQVDNAAVILADDVIFTGRTARASLNEIFNAGRPARVELAVLCDRGNRCLPVQADYTGLELPTAPDQNVEVYFSEDDPAQHYITVSDP